MMYVSNACDLDLEVLGFFQTKGFVPAFYESIVSVVVTNLQV
jgi:hypothetical protein